MICDEPFIPRYNQPNQMTCGKKYCAYAWRDKQKKIAIQETVGKPAHKRPGGFVIVRDPDVHAGLLPGLELSGIEVEAMLQLCTFTVGTIIQSKSRQYIIDQMNGYQIKRPTCQ